MLLKESHIMWKTNWSIGADHLAFRINLIENMEGKSLNFHAEDVPKMMSFIIFSKRFKFNFDDKFLAIIVEISKNIERKYVHSFFQTCYFKV
jgi:tRNA splicing ligase